ncbi:MAG: germination protein YpeB [Clostridia bacterium]|nr:germination protein YpeB [Clostridia bacterium]
MNESYYVANVRERDWTRILNVALAALLAGVLAFSTAQTARLNEANARINAVVQKAFYETCELTEGMSVNFRKLLVAGETGQMQALLNETALQTQGALSNLALLPLGQETVSATLKFINQAGDFASALSVRLGNGGTLTPQDYDTLEHLSQSAAAFSVGMGRLLDRYERGEAVFDAGDYAPTGQESLYPLTGTAAEYPVLLYDGPFSDGRADGEFKALAGLAEVDEPRARQALAAFIGAVRDAGVEFTGESAIPVECYEYTVPVGDYRLNAGVTKRGGQVLYVLFDGAAGEARLTDRQGVDAAKAFLMSRGYGEMELSYSSRFDGILTANFAAVQNGVVLYPDLVKVQVSLADGAIVGLEAANYLMNHVPRALEIPALSEQDATGRIGGALTPVSARLCVIPENTSEYLCYEVKATSGQDTFLAYIDAMTGVERKLMQVIEGENGALVM